MSAKKFQINKVAVLGSGVMGSQIAAHCVNAGLEVWLLDLKSEDAGNPDQIARENIKKLTDMNPSPLALPEFAGRIIPGNFQDNLGVVGEADWVCEAVVERMDIKKEMVAQIEKFWTPGTIVSSNTSGLPIGEISEDTGPDFQKHFLGTHFFNPPRYMKLLEVIPAPETADEVTDFMIGYCEKILGKGVVLCNDTPNFIANRIGVFSMATIMPWFFDGRFRAEELDLITGRLTGYSRAATFRTADMVGLDVLSHVAENLYPAVPEDERREVFRLPDEFEKMVENGWHGNKTGQGFYKKVKGKSGKEYHALNISTMEYEPQKKVQFDSIEKAEKEFKKTGERLKFLVGQDDLVGRFLWQIHCDLLLYSANRIPEITGSVEAIDRAMKWGFNWELGPFERWDAIGVDESVKRMEAEGRQVPGAVKSMLDSGRKNFYENGTVYHLAEKKVGELSPPARGAVTVALLSGREREVWMSRDAGLYDMGEGVALFEFRTKQLTLGIDLVESVEKACEKVTEGFDALVIGHDHQNFSFGANLVEVVTAISEGDRDNIERMVNRFQKTAVGLRYQPFPVVGAVSGMTLGGGAEFMMHCDKVVAHHELYCGLVELGVGLIPGGGGTKELLLRTMDNVVEDDNVDPLPFVRQAFKTIGMAKVSDGAPKARKLGYLRDEDMVVMNRDLLLATARGQARALADAGYRPPVEPKLRVLGRTGYSALKLMVYIMKESKSISSYDEILAGKVAWIMSGGDLSEPQLVPESHILKLEREAIFELIEEKRTLERMKHMLETGKPLRN